MWRTRIDVWILDKLVATSNLPLAFRLPLQSSQLLYTLYNIPESILEQNLQTYGFMSLVIPDSYIVCVLSAVGRHLIASGDCISENVTTTSVRFLGRRSRPLSITGCCWRIQIQPQDSWFATSLSRFPGQFWHAWRFRQQHRRILSPREPSLDHLQQEAWSYCSNKEHS